MDLEKIRSVRTNPDVRLKPTPYLKASFLDEYGDEQQIVVRNYQAQGIMNLLMTTRMVLGDDTGLGKAQPVDSRVMTPSGWRKIGDLVVGDYVIGSDGLPKRVDGIFPQGVKPVFRVTMTDGSSTECCDEHLWTVRSGNTRRFGSGWRTKSLRQIMNGGLLRQRGSTGRKWSVPMVAPVPFVSRSLPVDPYLLGVLLGDGSMPGTVSVCNGDPKLFDLVEAHLPSDCRLGKLKKDGFTKPIVGKPGVRNSLKRGLLTLDLVEKNWSNKFIPKLYMTASLHQRVELLRGLMDTDGYVSKDGFVTQFFSSNLGLVGDFVELVQSLGGTASVTSKTPVLRGKSRAKRGRLAHTVTLSLPNEIIPFHLPRKVSRWRPRTKYLPARYIERIEPSREAECVCIRVDSPDSLYVTDGYILTHNTLEVLSAIGYVWLVEPEYVPIVITRKSSLFQWDRETHKFMQGMESVVVDGEPYERDAIYKDFFEGHDAGKKRLLVMTYDMFLKDAEQSVVRDRSHKASKEEKRALKEARDARRPLVEAFDKLKAEFKSRFDGREQLTKLYLVERLKPSDPGAPPPSPPLDWTSADESFTLSVLAARDAKKEAELRVSRAKDLVEPPVVAPGVQSRLASFRKSHPGSKIMLVLDEVHVAKDYQGKLHRVLREMAMSCERVVGMTATPVKNRLMEFFSIFRVVHPGLFPKVTHFQRDFCHVKMQKIGGGRQIPIVIGHSKEQLEAFSRAVEPFYLSRRKSDVAKELPELVTREIICQLSPEQDELYALAELELEEKDSDPDADRTQMLRSMTMVQQASNAPQLLMDEDGNPFEGESSKLEQLVEVVQESPDTKVLVFSRFEQMITLIEKRLKKERIRCVRITGKEKGKERAENVAIYQKPDSGVNVMLITTAGTESLNLQATEHIVLVDNPWSWGDYVQLTGRAVRIGSRNLTVLVTHLVARRRDGDKTIDDYVLSALRSKKKIADAVAGEALKGGLEFASDDVVDMVMKIVRDSKERREGSPQDVREEVRRISSTSRKKSASRAKKAPPAAPQADRSELAVVDLSDFGI